MTTGERLWQYRYALLAVVAIGLAALLRASGLTEGFWINEVVSMEAARLPPGQLLHRVGFFDIHPPLFYLLLSLWTRIVGSSEGAARLLPFVFGLGTLVLVYLWQRKRSPWIALFTVLMLALSTFHIHYSTEVRIYSMSAFLATAFLWQYELLIDSPLPPSKRRWLLFLLTQVALLLTHYYTIFLVVMANAHFFTWRRWGQTRLFRWSITQGIAMALYSLWLPVVLVQFFHLPTAMFSEVLRVANASLFLLFLGPGPVHPAPGVAWFLTLMLTGLFLAGIVQRLRKRRVFPRAPVRPDVLSRPRTMYALVVVAACLTAPALPALVLEARGTALPLVLLELPRAYVLVFVALFFLLIGNLFNARVVERGHGLPALPVLCGSTVLVLATHYLVNRPFLPREVIWLLPPVYVLVAGAWVPRSLLPRVALIALLLSVSLPSLDRHSYAFYPRQDFKGVAEFIRHHGSSQKGTAVFVLPMWDRPGVEYYLGAGTANGIMSPSQLPPSPALPENVTVVLTRQAFDNKSAFLDSVESVLGSGFELVDADGVFRRAYVAVYRRCADPDS